MADDWQLFPGSTTYPGSDVYPGVWPTFTPADTASPALGNTYVLASSACQTGFETGTNGNTIATSDSGNPTAWNTVTIPAGGAAVYDNTHVHGGSLAGKLTGGTGNVGTKLIWSTAFGTQTDHYGRIYVYYTANPASTQNIVRFTSSGAGGAVAARIRVTTTGTVEIDYQSTLGAVTTASIGLNQWVRIEWHFVHSTTVGSGELKLFNTPDSVTATETVSYSNQNNFASCDTGEMTQAVAGQAIWFDDFAVAATSYPGPTMSSSTYSITLTASATATASLVQTASQTLTASVTATPQVTKVIPLTLTTTPLSASCTLGNSYVVLPQTFTAHALASAQLSYVTNTTYGITFNTGASATASVAVEHRTSFDLDADPAGTFTLTPDPPGTLTTAGQTASTFTLTPKGPT